MDTPIKYCKSNDNHVYKILSNGFVLHVNYEGMVVNLLSPPLWEDVDKKYITTITEDDFVNKFKHVTSILLDYAGFDNKIIRPKD